MYLLENHLNLMTIGNTDNRIQSKSNRNSANIIRGGYPPQSSVSKAAIDVQIYLPLMRNIPRGGSGIPPVSPTLLTSDTKCAFTQTITTVSLNPVISAGRLLPSKSIRFSAVRF